MLCRVGLTSYYQIAPAEYAVLLDYGLGLTDLAKYHSSMDVELPRNTLDDRGFCNRILHFAPVAIAFNGKKAAEVALR